MRGVRAVPRCPVQKQRAPEVRECRTIASVCHSSADMDAFVETAALARNKILKLHAVAEGAHRWCMD